MTFALNKFNQKSSNTKNGVLLAAKGENGQHGYLLELESNRLKLKDGLKKKFLIYYQSNALFCKSKFDDFQTYLQTTIDGASKTITMAPPEGFSDQRWHTLKIERRGSQVKFQLDGKEQIKYLAAKTDEMRLQSMIIGACKEW